MAESVYFPQIGRMLDPNSFFGRYFISEGYTFDTPVANTLGRGTPTVTDPSEEKSVEDYLNLDSINDFPRNGFLLSSLIRKKSKL